MSTDAGRLFDLQGHHGRHDVPGAGARGEGRAVVLWGLGVIEQHGPHLPLGTDVYMPSELLRRVRKQLARRASRA